MDELCEVVEVMGGPMFVASYLDLDEAVITQALAAPAGAWTDRVSRMVAENTGKLVTMPTRKGSFVWRLTRKRVVKDWLLLSRWSEAIGA